MEIDGLENSGEHLVILATPTSIDQVGLKARRAGYEVRDCFSIQMPSSTCLMGLLCRRPFGASITEQVVRNGAGALAIDAARIHTKEDRSRPAGVKPGVNMTTSTLHGNGYISESHKGGRFPANFLLVHGPGCKCIGTRKVRGATGNGDAPKGEHGKLVPLRRGTFVCRTNADGEEEIPKWNC